MIRINRFCYIIFLGVILFLSCILVISAQDVQVNHYTPRGSPVQNVYDTAEMDAWEITYWNNYITVNYPNATILEPATRDYNCHGYAWSVAEGGNEVWIGYSQIGVEEEFWDDGSYDAIPENVATKVSYSGDHSAVTTATSNYYISKWNRYPLVYHHKNYHPGYGTPNEFFIRSVDVPQDKSSIQSAINTAVAGQTINIASGTYNGSLDITKEVYIKGADKNSVTINGDVTFQNTQYASLDNVKVNGIIESDGGHHNHINRIITDERILWNSSDNGFISSVTANHTDKYSAKVYNSSYITINNFESTSSSKYGIYGSSSSSLEMEYLSLKEKTFAIQTISSTSGIINVGNFVDNDYDVWDAGSGVGYYLCFWSDNPPNLYGNVYYNPPPSQNSSSNLVRIEDQAIKAEDNIYSNITDDADFNEALNIFRMIKDKKKISYRKQRKI